MAFATLLNLDFSSVSSLPRVDDLVKVIVNQSLTWQGTASDSKTLSLVSSALLFVTIEEKTKVNDGLIMNIKVFINNNYYNNDILFYK